MEDNIYGYVRVSSTDQNEDRQLIAMNEKNVPLKNIYIDKQSGKNFDRPQYKKFVAQSERENIKKRQAEGIAAAKAKGVTFGRPAHMVSMMQMEARSMMDCIQITVQLCIRLILMEQKEIRSRARQLKSRKLSRQRAKKIRDCKDR